MGKVKDRDDLIKRIRNIEDKDVIDEIYRLLDVNLDESVYQLNEEQQAELEQAREEIKRGEGISSEHIRKELGEWLRK